MVCKICSSDKVKFLFYSKNKHGRHKLSEDEFGIYFCNECGVLFLEGVKVNRIYYGKYYKDNYYRDGASRGLLSRILTFFSLASIRRKERLILKYFDNFQKISILDVGCGDGQFLDHFNDNKFGKYGLELNQAAIKTCQKKGIFVYRGKLTDLNFKNKKFDVITMWHSFEHMADPVATLYKARKILSARGILVIQTPSVDSFGFKFGRENWFHLDSPRHLFIYSKKAIGELCKKTGLEIIEVKNEFYDYPLDLFWSTRSSLVKIVFYPLYPLIKLLSKEHLTYIIKSKPNFL